MKPKHFESLNLKNKTTIDFIFDKNESCNIKRFKKSINQKPYWKQTLGHKEAIQNKRNLLTKYTFYFFKDIRYLYNTAK